MSESFDRLVDIMARLRGENGCPWDREQNHKTLKQYLIEEAYEVLDAIDSGDMSHLKEELGDLLLQVVFHSQLASERGDFTVDDSIRAICEKLIRRHPHVFAESNAKTADEVLNQWEAIKRDEKKDEPTRGVLHGVPRGMPALLRATRLQKKAKTVGFDWDTTDEAFAKVDEEYHEFREAISENDPKKMEEELGDLLFSLVNVARFIEVNPEEALAKTIQKFTNRFAFIEEKIKESGRKMETASLEEMEELWNRAKEEKK